MPCGASVSGASGPPGLAATGMTGAPRNLEERQARRGHGARPGPPGGRSVTEASAPTRPEGLRGDRHAPPGRPRAEARAEPQTPEGGPGSNLLAEPS